MREDLNWQKYSNCVGGSPEIFFPSKEFSPNERKARNTEAKAVCAECLVKSTCLLFALESHEGYGTWGGMTERERRELKGSHKKKTVNELRAKSMIELAIIKED